MSPAGGKGDGVTVSRFVKGSKGAAAGIKVGDRIMSIDGKPTDSVTMVRKAIRDGGKKQRIELKRNENSREIVVEFEK